jgi:hypothetical protein
MTKIILATTLIAVIASTPAMAQQFRRGAFGGARAYAPHEYFRGVPSRSMPSRTQGDCSDPGAHIWCPAAPVHDNTPPP